MSVNINVVYTYLYCLTAVSDTLTPTSLMFVAFLTSLICRLWLVFERQLCVPGDGGGSHRSSPEWQAHILTSPYFLLWASLIGQLGGSVLHACHNHIYTWHTSHKSDMLFLSNSTSYLLDISSIFCHIPTWSTMHHSIACKVTRWRVNKIIPKRAVLYKSSIGGSTVLVPGNCSLVTSN